MASCDVIFSATFFFDLEGYNIIVDGVVEVTITNNRISKIYHLIEWEAKCCGSMTHCYGLRFSNELIPSNMSLAKEKIKFKSINI